MNPPPTQIQKLILIGGATGYIASRLIPRLLESGYRVRCLARNPERLRNRAWFGQVEVVAGDVTRAESLHAAMSGVSAAYYLIHSMAAGHGYHRIDLESARNFAGAAKKAGVEHIIYVGGLADPREKLAMHLLSRIESGVALREAGVPVTEFRAGVIAGPGSVSFEMIRFIAEQFPLMVGPNWLQHRSQPIATSDIIEYLLAALETLECRGEIVELGCEKSRSYIEVMQEYAQIRGLKRKTLLLPFIPPLVMAFMIDKLTPVEFSYALPLVEGLQNDSLVLEPTARRLFPHIEPLDYAEAVRQSLADLDPRKIEPIWLDSGREHVRLKHEGFLVDYRVIGTSTSPDVGNSQHREILESLSFPRVSGWETAAQDKGGTVLLQARGKLPGQLWFECGTMPGGKTSRTIFFAPKGLPGFLYWLMLCFLG
ncbi:MAG: NAD(P)H-binding protein, partial [Anaerolineales bacterium]